MKNRPVQVTVVAWFLMVTCALSAVMTLVMFRNPMAQELMAKNPLPVWFQYTQMAIGLAAGFLSGFFMLKAARWARALYVSWGTVSFALGLATSPMKWAMLPGLVFFIVVIALLFLPSSNAYFANVATPKNENSL